MRVFALGGTLIVHVLLGVWLWRLSNDTAAPPPDVALQVIWIDAAVPPPQAQMPTPPPRADAAQATPPRQSERPRPALQAVEVASPSPAPAPAAQAPRPSLHEQARALAREAGSPGAFDPDPLRHRPAPRADGRFAMRDPLSAQDVVNGIGALFGGGPSDPCPRIRQNLANANMGAGRELAEEEIRRLQRNCL